MANLREALAVAAFGSLEWSPERERSIDRVAASARCPELGVDLWKARYLLEVPALRRAQFSLIKECQARYRREKPEIVVKIVDQALHEFLFPFCEGCLGAKEIITRELRMTCPACGGSGTRRFSDTDRAGRMKLSYGLTKHLAHKISWLIERMSDLDRAVNAELNRQLERESNTS